MRYSFGVVCSLGIGPYRGGRESNEDTYILGTGGRLAWREGELERRDELHGDSEIVGVFDGMGGHQNGEVAAVTAARSIGRLYRPGLPRDPVRTLRRYVLDTHQRLHEQVLSKGPVQMGTTLAVVWLIEDGCAWLSVGDSRIYLQRDGVLTQISRDHTRAEFARREGRNEPEARHLAQNFLYGSRGLGDDKNIRVDEGWDCGWIELRTDDRLLLCTDGVWEHIDDSLISDVLRNIPDPQAAAVGVVERAMARGSTDNLTAAVVRVNAAPPADGTMLSSWSDEDDGVTSSLD